jgi:hypothetical protein
MAVISGVLKGPMGDARVGVVIELRAVRTSATVVIQARSQSVTDATGRYTLSVEPGQYDVMITAAGRQPERVGGIHVMVNSSTGTLNDFLTIPGENDLNPEIVATIDRMRADAAASAATAKTNADIAVAAVNDTLNKTILTPQSVAGSVSFKGGIISYGDQIMQATNESAILLRIRNQEGIEKSSIYCQTDTGVINYRWGGTAYTMQGRADGFVTLPKGNVISTSLATGAAVVEAVTATGGINNAPFNFRGSDSAQFANPSNYSIGTWYGFSVVPTSDTTTLGPGVTRGQPVFYVNARTGSAHVLNQMYVGTAPVVTTSTGFGGVGASVTYASKNDFLAYLRGTSSKSEITRSTAVNGLTKQWAPSLLMRTADTWSLWSAGAFSTVGAENGVRVAVGNTAGTQEAIYELWHTTNTTVDANGFIKKASPIVKLFGNGQCELNDESQGVTTERVSEGVYRISGTLGFNADAEWGGVDGGIEIPTDRNKLPLVWVDYEVDETGDLLIKTFHRVNSTAPKFAQNVKTGYKEGQPIDIPAGRWIDLRVEMPGGDEPEYVPVPEDEETSKVTELEVGEEPAPGEVPAQIEEPKE